MPEVAIPRAGGFTDPFTPDYDPDDAGTEMYFRFPNGEIKFARTGPDTDGEGSETRKLKAAGCTPLEEYGTFKVQPYHMDRPFEVLFQRGGAKELSIKEIIAQGLYFRKPKVPVCNATFGESWKNTDGQRGHKGGKRNNDHHTARCWKDAKEVEFPQMDAEKVAGPFLCKWCQDDDTGDERRFATERGLKSHQTVVHPDEIGNSRMADDLIKGLHGGAPRAEENLDLRGEMLKMQEEMEKMRELITPTPEKLPDFSPTSEYPCDVCGKVLSTIFGLQGHKRSHKGALVPA